jgi:hypothetical protein
MKPGQVFYLSRPDIPKDAQTHGYLWVSIRGWYYKSVATGEQFMLYPSELTPLEQDDAEEG